MGINDLNSSLENIKKIYNSKLITLQNKIILVIGFILHWIFIIGIATYFIWGKPEYDIYLFYTLIFLFITWNFVWKDCIASYYEKKIIKNVLDLTRLRNPSINLYNYTNNVTILIDILICVLPTFNFAFVMIRNNFPNIIIFFYIIFSVMNNLFQRYTDLTETYELKSDSEYIED